MRHGLCLVSLAAVCLSSANFAAAQAPVPASVPSFVNDVEPILTRLGCNQGACHGKGAGQNGFRLSLRGYAPEWDHAWIARESGARRVNPANPEASLLLLKPTGQAAHEGGVLMTRDSREYRVLLDWLRGGAPGVNKSDPAVRRIEILAGDRTLKPGQTQQLLVRAEYTDGQRKDVMWLTKFDSNDAGVATVSPGGLLKVERSGETAIRAMFAGQVAVLVVTAPFEAPVKADLFRQKNNFIDEHLFKKLADLRIEPAELCGDNVFIRRVYLDAMGTLPTPAEVREFLVDKTPNRRARLIDRVLDRPECVDFWTLQMDDLFMNRRESDHDVRGAKGIRNFHEWIRGQVARNRPWDEMVRELLTATGTTDEHPEIGYFIVNVGEQREAQKSSVVANAAQTFLGVRIGCAQCHNHPLEKYTQDDYYHFAGYFSRIQMDRKNPSAGATRMQVMQSDGKKSKAEAGVVQPRTGKFLKPQLLDRTAPEIAPDQDPRQVLAAWITDPKNEYFAGAMVNRLWAHYFSVGLVEPVDDLRESNPPTNPELWKALVKEFVASKYDRKHLMRLILNSRAYQLSSATRPGNEKDHRSYSHYYARRLPAEVIHDVLLAVTGVADAFEGYPLGMRAVQIPDPVVKSRLLAVFGRPERITACACERSSEVTLVHTLHMMSGDNIGQKIRAGDGRLAQMLKTKKNDMELLDELMMMAFARVPTNEERQTIARHFERCRLEARDRSEAFEELTWVLVNAKEFLFNH